MSDATQSRSASRTSRAAADDRPYDPDRGLGWVVFAGCMLCLVGTLNIIYGIAAISNSKFYTANATYVFSDLKTWGWVLLIIGVIQFVAAFGIWAGSEWGRWVGIVAAGANAIAQMLFIPAYPFLSLALFAIDLLVIYGLVAYGGTKYAR